MTAFARITLSLPPHADATTVHIAGIFRRHLTERCGADLTAATTDDPLAITLALEPGIGTEGYRITETPDGLRVAGDDALGLLAGVGALLHGASFGDGTFTPGSWRGTSVPACPLRGIYFALHNNWYNMASPAEVYQYMEDLALWGINTICFHLPQHENPHAPEAVARRAENYALLQAAKRTGLRVALIKEPNIGFCTVPDALLAPEFPDTDPPRRGHSGTRVCPSAPKGFAYLSAMLADYLDGYEDIGIDYVVAFPYDSGGCGCAQCWPWGARGYLTISKEFARLTRARYPNAKFVLGAWCFDVMDTPDGEFEGVDQALRADAGWVDYIMADSHYDFPEWLLQHGSPAGLPMINFAEISMWGRFPWGGFGANPLPERYQRLWNQSKHLMSGGLPYSEGNFEDINKVLYARFFWEKETTAAETLRAYIAYEFSPDVVELVAEAISLLEANYPRVEWTLPAAERARALLQQADALLPARAKASWRWRILYLRALIDVELITHDNAVSDRCDAAYEELLDIFHLQNGWRAVSPESRAYMARYAAILRGETPSGPPGSDQGMVSDAGEGTVETLPPGAHAGTLTNG
jgi:hypothetical protein